MSILQKLTDKYFYKLEENLVDYTETDEAGVSFVKSEYLYKTVSEMCEYIGMEYWVIEWTQEIILYEMNEELKKLNSKYKKSRLKIEIKNLDLN